ncbi:MAG: GNAT family N-acetyltransferase [Candidatus Heimdallarchaeota archaeon]|nr:GNAT family N-acetyltransferase [Candidatus Heimdallarchaeota archaeon]
MKVFDYLKILYQNQIIGGLLFNSRKKGRFILKRIFIDPEYHNKGIATQLMPLLFHQYPETVWTLDTPVWNARTCQFYEKLGFVHIGWVHGFECKFIWFQRGNPTQIATIRSLREGMTEVLVEGEVVHLDPSREVKSKRDGKILTVANAILQDSSGDIVLVFWNEQIAQVKLGDRIRVEFGKTSSYQGTLQLSTGFGRLIKLI